MKMDEIRKLSDEDLIKKEKELREELGNLAFQHGVQCIDLCTLGCQGQKIIGMVETVISPVGGYTMVDRRQRIVVEHRIDDA